MILQALCGYYQRLADDQHSAISPYGYAVTNVGGEIVLDENGVVVGAVSLMEGKRFKEMITPLQPKRTAVNPAFLCDNAGYFFGANDSRGEEKFLRSKELHANILSGIDDVGAKAVLRFFESFIPGNELEVYVSPLLNGGNLVFRLENVAGYIHDRPKIKAAWSDYFVSQGDTATIAQCLVTGEQSPIARLHGNMSGFGQDKPTLAAFKQEAFESFRKEQGDNAPVSLRAEFQYVTALNSLMKDKDHQIRLGGDKVVFWAERDAKNEEALLADIFADWDADFEKNGPELDEATTRSVQARLKTIFTGKRPSDPDIDENVRFYLLGMTSNRTRLVIRFFYSNTFGELLNRISKHYHDINVVASPWDKPNITPRDVLLETAVEHKYDNIPPLLESALMRSILWGTVYPYGLFTALMGRIRAEAGGKNKYFINRVRIGMIKGFINRRRNSKELMTVALNPAERNTGYLLGRMFAIFEKAQSDALGDVNASVVDKYLNSALATPQTVLPMLLSLFEKHVSKSGKYYAKTQISEIMENFSSDGFPQTMNSEDQGRLLIGYYHQRQSLYTKKKDNNNVQTEELENA